MDSDIEILDDVEGHSQAERLLNDFSHVKILVHGADVAERILGNLDIDDQQVNFTGVLHRGEESAGDVFQINNSSGYPGNCNEISEPVSVPIEKTHAYPEPIQDSLVDGELKPVLENDAEIFGDYSERDSCNYIDDEPETDPLEPDTLERNVPESEADLEDIQNEIPSLEDHTNIVTQGQIQNDSYEDVAIKEEIDFDCMDYTDFDEVHSDIYNNDQPPEDIYHFKNKFILGSKPCKEVNTEKPHENDIQKEQLNTEVLLEDWAEHLDQNPCFCNECGILFSTPNGLDSHKMATHSFLVAISNNKAVKSTTKPAFARKSTGFKANKAKKSTGQGNLLVSKLCNHCNMEFPDHTDLIKHLYELLPFSKQFACNTCQVKFNSQKELMSHNAVHIKKEKPKAKKQTAVKEERVLKKELINEEDLKKKQLSSPKKEAEFVPLSAMFLCPKCNTHFLYPFAAIQHIAYCNSNTVSRKIVICNICNRKLRETDAVKHKRQHEVCNKFKVYKMTKNLYERTLSNCPNCRVNFSDTGLNLHLKNCGKIPALQCQKCDLLIPKYKMPEHQLKHEKENLKRKDFIVVQYFIVENKAQKRKKEPITTPAKRKKLETSKIKKEPVPNTKIHKVISTKIKKEPMIKKKLGRLKTVNKLNFKKQKKLKLCMLYCKHCERCYMKIQSKLIHMSKKCKENIKYDIIACEQCGLNVSRKGLVGHLKQHRKRTFTIHDVAFYNIPNLKRTVPSIPTYPQCQNCKIIFITKKFKKQHICGENYKTCKVCGDKFDVSTFNLHIEFHKLTKTQSEGREAKLMPELIEKYESLNMMWNIVYFCTKCDTVTDSYDKVVEHSQGHIQDNVTSKNIKCYICNLKFDETCWSKHSDLHLRMQINSKDFKILNYDPYMLLADEWFELFAPLPESQIGQIIHKSLYGDERSVTLKLLKDGRPEFTLHLCSVCKICFHNDEIINHMSGACNNPEKFCTICNIAFNNVNTLRQHELLHLKGIKKDEFRIVSFVKSGAKRKISNSNFVISKCSKCGICVRHSSNIDRHTCRPKSHALTCHICHLSFNKRMMPLHNKEHTLKPNFKPENIQVRLFNPRNRKTNNLYYNKNINNDIKPVKRKYQTDNKKSKPAKVPKSCTPRTAKCDTSIIVKSDVKTARVFKCECGLHFTSMKTIEKHMETCLSDSNISKENCSKCGLLFPTDVLVSHLCKHHSKNTKIVIEMYKKTDVPENSFESVESTSETTTSLTTISTKNTANTSTQNPLVKLYKCSPCNVYYMAQNTCYRHIYKDHIPLDPKQYIECKLCGLQFKTRTLSVHVSHHHQKEFNLDNVLVEEYHPRVVKGPVKIDSYIASEKFQSLQVTSSIEEA